MATDGEIAGSPVGDDAGPGLTLQEALALMPPVWDAIERTVLEHVAAECIAQGFSPPAVRFLIEEYARALAGGRQQRLETARQMLEARATSLQ
jgi:hypothetical protein